MSTNFKSLICSWLITLIYYSMNNHRILHVNYLFSYLQLCISYLLKSICCLVETDILKADRSKLKCCNQMRGQWWSTWHKRAIFSRWFILQLYSIICQGRTERKEKRSNIFLAHSNLKEPFQRFAVCFCFLPISTREELRYIYGLTEKSSVKQYLTYFFRENPKPQSSFSTILQ